jgi:hypothetical protein
MHQTESFRTQQATNTAPSESQTHFIGAARERIARIDTRRLGTTALFSTLAGILVTTVAVEYKQTYHYEDTITYAPKDFTFLKEEKGESFKDAFFQYGKARGWTKAESADSLRKLMSFTMPRVADSRAALRAGLKNDTAERITIVDMAKKAQTERVVAIDTYLLTNYAAPQTSTADLPRQP